MTDVPVPDGQTGKANTAPDSATHKHHAGGRGTLRDKFMMHEDSIAPALAGWIGVGLIALGVLAYAAAYFLNPEASLGFDAISGIVLLSVSLYGLVVLTRALGISDPTQALGLPTGSIRALLALILAIVFVAVASWTLGGMLDPKGPVVFRGDMKPEDIGKTYPPDKYIVYGSPVKANGEETVQAFVRQEPPSHDVMDIAKQLITISATVLVTIVGFYFGSKSASEAARNAGTNFASVQQALNSAGGQGGGASQPQAGGQPPPTGDSVVKDAGAIAAIASSMRAKLNALGPSPLDLVHTAADGQDDVKDELAKAVQSYTALQSACKTCEDVAQSAKAVTAQPPTGDAQALQEIDVKLQKLYDQASQANHDFASAYNDFGAAREAILKRTAKG